MEIVNVKTENLAIANELKDYLIKHKISNVDADMFLEVIDFIRIDREKQLKLCEVGVTLPTKEEINIRLKTVVEQVFEENQTIEKKEYSSGFISCYYWLKIRQMSNGN